MENNDIFLDIYQLFGVDKKQPFDQAIRVIKERLEKFREMVERKPTEESIRILNKAEMAYKTLLDENRIKYSGDSTDFFADFMLNERILDENKRDRMFTPFEPRENKNYKIVKEGGRKQVKGRIRKPNKFIKIVIGGVVVLVGLIVVASIVNKPGVDNPGTTTVNQSVAVENEENNLVEITYIIETGDTKESISKRLELNENEKNKLPSFLYEGSEYKLNVKNYIAENYNYNKKKVCVEVFSYELPSGGSLFDIADCALEEYPEIFGGLTRNQIVSQIAFDNNCTVSSFPAGTYTIYFHAPQKEIDELTNEGLLPNLNNSMHTN